MSRSFRQLALSILFTGLTALAPGCTTDDVCESGETCACAGLGSCTWSCPDGDCSFDLAQQGLATISCDGGGCDVTSASQGTVEIDCAGGNCSVETSGQGAVDLTCAGGGCDIACDGQGECTTFECSDCTCTAAPTATCSEG